MVGPTIKWAKEIGVMETAVKCEKCKDKGFIVTSWEPDPNDGDPEVGPLPFIPTYIYFCDCETGTQAAIASADQSVGYVMSQLPTDRTEAIEFLINEHVISLLHDGTLWTGWTDSSDEDFKASAEMFIRNQVSGSQLEARHRAYDQRVTKVWWCFGSEIAMEHRDIEGSFDGEYVEGRYDGQRLTFLADRIVELAKAQWPNTTDWWVTDGGFENSYAQFSPRVEMEDGTDLEYGIEALQEFEDQAITEMWEKWPEPTDEGDLISDTEARRIASDWHGGGGTALYALSSTGAINTARSDHNIGKEIMTNVDETGALPNDLESLLLYVRRNHESRGPVEGWSGLRPQ